MIRFFRPVLLLCWFAGLTPVVALTGTIVDDKRAPLEGARVCYTVEKSEGICALTDARGFFDLPESTIDRITIHADGHLPLTVAAVQQRVPIALRRAASLRVRVREVDGEFLSGIVYLMTADGRRRGPLPVRPGGLSVKTLAPGSYGVVVEVEGYTQQGNGAIELEPGKTGSLLIEMSRAPAGASGL